MRDLDGREIGVVVDVYRVGGAEVFVVRGEPYGEFDLPAVRAFIRIFAPTRGEIVVDVDALALEPAKPPRPAAARHEPGRATAARRPGDGDRGGARRRRPPTALDAAHRRRRRGPEAMTLEIDVLTLFPAMLEAPAAATASRPGSRNAAWRTIRVRDLREWGIGPAPLRRRLPLRRRRGMVLRPEPVAAALASSAGPGRRSSSWTRRRAVRPGARRVPCRARAPRLRLPSLRRGRRADPLAWSTSSSPSATTS